MVELLLILAAAAAAAAALAGLGYLLVWFLLHGRRDGPGWEKLEGFRYAHRGLHGPGVPENSLAAFRRAAEAGVGVYPLSSYYLAPGTRSALPTLVMGYARMRGEDMAPAFSLLRKAWALDRP